MISGMPQNFLACDREQSFLLPPDVREWLPENHLAWFVIDTVAVMDTAAVFSPHRGDGHRGAALQPSGVPAPLLFFWARGTPSSPGVRGGGGGGGAPRGG